MCCPWNKRIVVASPHITFILKYLLPMGEIKKSLPTASRCVVLIIKTSAAVCLKSNSHMYGDTWAWDVPVVKRFVYLNLMGVWHSPYLYWRLGILLYFGLFKVSHKLDHIWYFLRTELRSHSLAIQLRTLDANVIQLMRYALRTV